MIILESKIIVDEPSLFHDEKIYHCPKGRYVDGYFLTLNDLEVLVRAFHACHDGFTYSDKAYIEQWLKNHNRIVEKD